MLCTRFVTLTSAYFELFHYFAKKYFLLLELIRHASLKGFTATGVLHDMQTEQLGMKYIIQGQ